ncbi:hypothetical protein KP509_22G075800 [Ceratopteris richardii]|uniref:CCHC-type domain-containing protein n=1 Tax=Ceratopteris richardii TaxID=49495 RepID=A0A8T2S6G4_CERRI|nr:hypothetical protein KP509_22G075800 [Ceratopteris richardii]
MGANAPNDETLKRRFIAGLRDPTAQQHISLTRPATLIDAKEQARLWEEVQLCQQRKMELLYEPMGGPGNIPMKDSGQGSPALTTPAFVAATSMPSEVKPALTEERALELVTQAIKAVTMTQETYTVKQEVTTNPNQVFRSNTWCGKCHGYGHLASECPTVSRVFTNRSPPRMRCTFCGRKNHTEDRCYNKRAYEERTMKSGDTRERRDGPIQCWRCHGFGHTQSRCPNEKKPVDYTPLCRYCNGEGHFDEDCPKQRASTSKDKGPVGSSNYVETQMHSTSRAQEPLVNALCGCLPGQEIAKEPIVAVVTMTQEYFKKHPEGESEEASQEKIPEHGDVENQVGGFAEQQEFEDGEEIEILPPVIKEFVPGIAPFLERLRAPKCRKERQSLEEVDIVKLLADTEVTLYIGTLLKSVTVKIKGYAVPGAQLDSGAAINLMIEYMMKALGLNHMEETPMSLRMADQTQVKPAGLLKNVSTVVGGLEFKVDYLIVRPRTSETTFSILLGRPWLMQANCVDDWRTGFISIGPKSDPIQIQVSPNSTDKKKTIIVDEMEMKAKEKRAERTRIDRWKCMDRTSSEPLDDDPFLRDLGALTRDVWLDTRTKARRPFSTCSFNYLLFVGIAETGKPSVLLCRITED